MSELFAGLIEHAEHTRFRISGDSTSRRFTNSMKEDFDVVIDKNPLTLNRGFSQSLENMVSDSFGTPKNSCILSICLLLALVEKSAAFDAYKISEKKDLFARNGNISRVFDGILFGKIQDSGIFL